MILWDSWGLEAVADPSAAQLALLDRVAEALLNRHTTARELRSLYDRDEFRIPALVTSYSAASATPQQITLRPLD